MKVSHYYGKTPSSKAKNKWGTTTGKHLNAINQNKSIRVEHSEILKIIKNIKITLD